MNAPRLTRRPLPAAHICSGCELPFVQPEFGVQEGVLWRVFLRCGSCGWTGEKLLDADALERLETEVDAERDQIAADLRRLMDVNMRDYYQRFVAALAADAILPEDF